MTRIALVVSDVDGTLLTKDKILTDKTARAVRQLEDSGVAFTIVSSRPTVGMRFLVEPLRLTMPFGSFNGGAICDPQMKPIEQHLIPASTVQKTIDVLKQFGVDIWLFTHDQWLITNPDGHYNPFEKRTIKADPIVVDDLSPYLAGACKIVGSSSDAELLARCEAAVQTAVGDQATAARSQSYYLDITPPGVNKGTFVKAMAARLRISTDAVATVGDMHNDVAMFKTSGMSIAMGNAADDIKRQATHATTSNAEEGFAGAMDIVMKNNDGKL
jgi:Cof subfamily protein (haloacid dehalogenase superfamily)